jgi:ribosomal protein S18 acetylase RimI-like enzyme
MTHEGIFHRHPTACDLTASPYPSGDTPRPIAERSAPPEITLVPMSATDLEAFIDEEVADYADEQVLNGTWSRREALERSRGALVRVIAWEHAAVRAERQRLLTARDVDGARVGWLWIKLGPEGPWSTSAFLCQMTVVRSWRHHGYGRSMLAALEALLAGEGISDLFLNVCETNLPAKSLYVAAGYQLNEQYPTMRQLHKHLAGAPSSTSRASDPARVPVG